MAIAYRASSGAVGGATAAALSIVIPAGTAEGDQMLLFCTTATVTYTYPTPSGWTLLHEDTDAQGRYKLFRRTAAAGDAGTTVSSTFSAAQKYAAGMVVYSGVSTTAPVHVSARRIEGGTAVTAHPTPPR